MNERARSDEMMDGPEAVAVLCPHCLQANAPSDHFCRRCATPLTSYAATDPLGRVFAEGDTFRKAVNHPARPLVLIGMWLLFAPAALESGGMMIERLMHPIQSRGDAIFFVISLGIFGATAAVSCAVLFRVTRNFVRMRGTRPSA